MLKIPRVFHADRRSAGAAADANITDHATRILRRVARDLHLMAAEHEIVSQPARRGRGCKVALRTRAMMLEVADSPTRQSVTMAFRTRRGHSDLSGGGENVVPLEQLTSREGYESLLNGLRLTAGLDVTYR